MIIEKILRKIINSLGYDICPITLEPRKARTSLAEAYAHLSGLGFQPKTVVDVGVASGTQELYQAFPDSFFVLIEPLKAFEPQLLSILERYKGLYVLAAAGAKTGQALFHAHPNHLEGSSLYKESIDPEADGEEISVPMIRVDDILAEQGLQGPFLLKVDVQGAELQVLEGAQRTLTQTEVVVLEASLFAFLQGAPQFFDVIGYMKERGFVVYDLIPGWHRPLDNALAQVDLVFVKEEGRFRQNHAFATAEQRQTFLGA